MQGLGQTVSGFLEAVGGIVMRREIFDIMVFLQGEGCIHHQYVIRNRTESQYGLEERRERTDTRWDIRESSARWQLRTNA